MRIERLRKLLIWLFVLAFSFGGVTPALAGSRIMPAGKVDVYRGQKLVQILRQESVFPNGALLITEGRCGVRLENFYLLAEDGSTFGVVQGLNRKNLRVDNGVVYFGITPDVGKVTFLTPAGVLSAVQIRFDASANGSVLKGYLDVGGSRVQLGVLEGGSIILSTSSGEKVVRTGKQITLAFLDLITDEDKKALDDEENGSAEDKKASGKKKKDVAAEEDDGHEIPAAYFIGGGAVLSAGVIGLAGGSSGSDGPVSAVSQSSPTP